jgi:hypothetical protein
VIVQAPVQNQHNRITWSVKQISLWMWQLP